MPGAVLIAIVMGLVVPALVMLVGAVWSAVFGWMSTEDAERRHKGEAASAPD